MNYNFNVPEFNWEKNYMYEKRIQKLYPEFHSFLYKKYPHIKMWMEKLYLFYNNLDTPPKCANKKCNNNAKFKSLYQGYSQYCCIKCSSLNNSNSKALSKYLRNNFINENDFLLGYTENGDWICKCPHPETCKNWNNCEHCFITNCGTYHYRKDNNFETCTIITPINKSNRFKNSYKIYEDYFRIYKCPHPETCKNWNNCEHQFIIQNYNYRCRIKFGAETCTILNPLNSCKNSENQKERYKNNNLTWLIGYTDNNEYICKCPHPNTCEKWSNCKHQFIINKQLYYYRKCHDLETCTIINKKGIHSISGFEKKIRKILKQLNVECEYNIKNIIFGKKRPLELDIILKILPIAIEINGSRFHSITYKYNNKKFHFEKFIKCVEKGIELISIWEDWSYDDIRNFLKAKLDNDWETIYKYKRKWFPDLLENEWPLDLGFPKDFNAKNINIKNIKEHFCYHKHPYSTSEIFECYDSGIYII